MLLPNHQMRRQRWRQATATSMAPQVTESKCESESCRKGSWWNSWTWQDQLLRGKMRTGAEQHNTTDGHKDRQWNIYRRSCLWANRLKIQTKGQCSKSADERVQSWRLMVCVCSWSMGCLAFLHMSGCFDSLGKVAFPLQCEWAASYVLKPKPNVKDRQTLPHSLPRGHCPASVSSCPD